MPRRFDPKLWCVSVYFNPAGFDRTARNFAVFSRALRESGANLLTLELSFDGRYYLPEDPHIIRLRGRSPMWQKERLISHAVTLLPAGCEYVAWLDCDLIFPEVDWIAQAVEKLQQADLIQLFARIHRVGRPSDGADEDYSRSALQARVQDVAEGVVHQRSRLGDGFPSLRGTGSGGRGVPGYCWAARRSFFNEVGLYDRAVVGAGDKILAYNLLEIFEAGDAPFPMSPAMLEDVCNWAARLRQRNYRVDHLPLDVLHLWHGRWRDRQYAERHTILREACFDPATDVKVVDGVLEWASDKHHLHQRVLQFFQRRSEDG
jgi:hypothetical protein